MPDTFTPWIYARDWLNVMAAIVTITGTYIFRHWLMRILRIRWPIHGLQMSMYHEIQGFNATLEKYYVKYRGSRPGRSTECFVLLHQRRTRKEEHVTLWIKSTTFFEFEASISQMKHGEPNTILLGRWGPNSEGRHWETRTTPGSYTGAENERGCLLGDVGTATGGSGWRGATGRGADRRCPPGAQNRVVCGRGRNRPCPA